MPYFGAQNVGAGWGPPPGMAELLWRQKQANLDALGQMADMVAGAVSGGLGKDLVTGERGGLKGALKGAGEAVDPELKRQNQEWQALQMYAEAAHGLPKKATNILSLPELKGLVQGLEAQQLQQKAALEEARIKAVTEYYRQGRQIQQQAQAFREQQQREQEKWWQHYTDAIQAYDDANWAARYATQQVPGGVPVDYMRDLLKAVDKPEQEFEPQLKELGDVKMVETSRGHFQVLPPEKDEMVKFAFDQFEQAYKSWQEAGKMVSDLSDPRVAAQLRGLREELDYWRDVYLRLTGKDLRKAYHNPAPAGGRFIIKEYIPKGKR